MTIFDGIIIGVALLSALMGLIRGLTREVLGLASWIGGASLTFIGMPFVQIIARRYIQNGMMADVAAAVGLFLIFLILFSVISHTLSGLIRQSVLGGIDRSLGFLFGIGRGIVVLCVFQLLISCFVPRQKQPENFQNNRFAPMIYKGSDLIFSLLPHQIASKIFEQQQKLVSDISAVGAANMANTMNAAVNNATGFATPSQIANNLKQQSPNTQQEAENLARLQPRAVAPTEGANVTAKQQNDMNRFLNLQDMDEESALEAESQAEIPPAPMTAMAPTMMPQQQGQQPMMPSSQQFSNKRSSNKRSNNQHVASWLIKIP
ncbi:MAG: CvpA family protein [Pseudomonadota bacterium]|nr:CvpA family protein [Alphaproteobacteria bacterium]MDP5370481.1 CvpA family protein [Pseudomonadota bacterium]